MNFMSFLLAFGPLLSVPFSVPLTCLIIEGEGIPSCVNLADFCVVLVSVGTLLT